MITNPLTPEEAHILNDKGTERPFSGEYDDFYANGFYTCRKCNTPLYRSMDKFNSGCGWPSFDDEIPGRVKREPDADGQRIEIVCASCGGHLGHVFLGEQKTVKDTRHCVNSLSMRFYSITDALAATRAGSSALGAVVVAGGCFWGVEYYFEQEKGILATAPGYAGGVLAEPTYRQVCAGDTGHAEAVLVIFEPQLTNAETLYRLFFDIHDATQIDGQGPDIGYQYRSAIFTVDASQEAIAKTVMADYSDAVTQVQALAEFWPAENEHHHYYRTRGEQPYCHFRR